MHIEFDGLKIYKGDKSVDLISSYDSVLNLFDQGEIFKYNDRNVFADSYHKVVVNEAYPTIRIPMNGGSYIKIQWHGKRETPINITIYHGDFKKSPFGLSYDELLYQCETGNVNIPINCANSKRSEHKCLDVDENLTFLDACKLSKYCNCKIDIGLISYKKISFFDGGLDGQKCFIKVEFDENDKFRFVSLYPHYEIYGNCIESTINDAKIARDKILPHIKNDNSNNGGMNGEFYFNYTFPNLKLHFSLTYTPRDCYPEWSGFQLSFK